MSFTEYVVEFILIVYLFSAIMFLIRIVRGPTIFDRIVAVDALSYDLTVFMALIAFYVNRPLVATPMILIALWAYALDVCISRALRHRDMG
ncbi:MAG: monovalent cation/H+ antiporter complex subunit F [Ignisphaera sp.]